MVDQELIDKIVVCTKDDLYAKILTKGKSYKIIYAQANCYSFIGDDGQEHFAHRDRFEIKKGNISRSP